MIMPSPYRSYTRGERFERAALVARGAKQSMASGRYDDGNDIVNDKLQRAIDRIDDRAEERGAREAGALWRQVEQARNEHAACRAAERAASREERRAAKDATRRAKQALDRAERAARRAGL